MSVMGLRFLLLSLVVLIQPTLAGAADYRLQVVSLYEDSFVSYLDAGRAVSPLGRLESALDRQQIDKGTVLYDRWVEPADASTARAFGATPVRADLVGGREPFLPEFRWQGEPGTRTLWVIKTRSVHYQELRHLALKGAGPLRHVRPFGAALRPERSRAVGLPANLIDFSSERPGSLARLLARYLDLTDGVAAVVGIPANQFWSDQIYLVIEHPAEPRTSKVVLGWRPRGLERDDLSNNPGDPGIR